jgi:nucleoprotein TPR
LLFESNQMLALHLDKALAEGGSLEERCDALQADVEKKGKLLSDLDRELADKTLQLNLALDRNQKQRVGGAGGATPRRASLGGAPMQPTFGTGVSAAAASPGFGPLTPDAVISEHLVPFRDISELIDQNAKLLRTVRALSQQHEDELADKEQQQDAAVAVALAEVESLRQTARLQQQKMDQLASQRDLYRSLRAPEGGAVAGSPTGTLALAEAGADASMAEAIVAELQAALEKKAGELADLKQHSAQTEAKLREESERARKAEQEARVHAASLEGHATVYKTRLETLEQSRAAGGEELSRARRDHASLSSQLIELQALLKQRSEDLNAAKAEAKQHASAAELARQEKVLLADAQRRLSSELEAQIRSNVSMQQTMQQMSEAHTSLRQAESDASKKLQSDAQALRAEWVEAKASLGRERERAADAKREADMQLALAREATATEQVSVVHGLLIASSDCL